MTEQQVLHYVTACAAALDLPLDPERAQRVAGHLTRTAALAQLLEQVPLGVEHEVAEIFCPAPFPTQATLAQLARELT